MRFLRLLSAVPVLLPLLAHTQQPVAPAVPGPVTALVFADFACPYSAQLHFTLERLEARYGDRLQVLVRNSPLPIHPDAPLAHRAALAAGRQGKSAQMADLLYANQTHESRSALLVYARQLHLDVPRFERDLDSPEVAAQLDRDEAESRALNVSVTPTLYVDGQRLEGTQSEDGLAGLIDTRLTRKTAASQAALAAPPASPALPAGLAAALAENPSAVQGPPDAPLTIVEFTDFQCPFCRQAVAPMEQLVAAHGREVRWVFRSFPLDFHPDSELANEAALAAGEQGRFWPMHDLLFANQGALKRPDLERYATQAGLNLAAFDQALDTHRFAGRIAADRALGERAGVGGTPTFVIDGKLVTGVRSLPELTQLLAQHTAAGARAGTQVATVAIPQTTPGIRVLGPPDPTGPVLTWFGDVRSPLAARQAELVRTLVSHYPTLQVYFKPAPVANRADGRLGAQALLVAAGKDHFWPMYDALAERRDTLDRARMSGLAGVSGYDATGFAQALDAAEKSTTVDDTLDEAARRGITGAPVFFLALPGRTEPLRIDGLQPEQVFTVALDAPGAGVRTASAGQP